MLDCREKLMSRRNATRLDAQFCTAVELAVVYNLDNGGNRGGAEDLTLMLSEAN